MSVEDQITIAKLRLRSALERDVARHSQHLAMDFSVLRRRLLRRMRRDMVIGDRRREVTP